MKKILIIEDDPITAKIYRAMLEKQGCEVEVAADGQSGFDRVSEFRPDALLLDLMLPKTSGTEIIQKIRALNCFRDLPIIAFTNAFVPGMIENALKAGATKVFNKSSLTRSMLIESLAVDKLPAASPTVETVSGER